MTTDTLNAKNYFKFVLVSKTTDIIPQIHCFKYMELYFYATFSLKNFMK